MFGRLSTGRANTKSATRFLRETQLALRETEKKQKPGVIRYHYSHLSPYLSGDSLAFELEDSIRKDFDYPIGLSPAERK